MNILGKTKVTQYPVKPNPCQVGDKILLNQGKLANCFNHWAITFGDLAKKKKNQTWHRTMNFGGPKYC
ncbi:unnamed protein product, partial [Larinioides sclopetarius]